MEELRDEFYCEICTLLDSKQKDYGCSDDAYRTTKILEMLDPNFRLTSAIKHIIAYMNTRQLKELIKAAGYLCLEYMHRRST